MTFDSTGSTRRTFLRDSAAATTLIAAPAYLRLASAQAAGDIRVGVMRPLSGPFEGSYKTFYYPADLAIDEINAAGGILGRKLVKVEVDDEGSAAKAPLAVRKLIDEKVHFMIGPTGSSQAISSLAVSTPNKVIQACSGTADVIADGEKYPYNYLFCGTSTAWTIAQVVCLSALGKKKIGLLAEDTAAGKSFGENLNRLLPKRGLALSSTRTFVPRAGDLTPFLRAMREEGTEVISFQAGNSVDTYQLFVSLDRIGWKPPVVGNANLLGNIENQTVMPYPEIYSQNAKALTYTDKEPVSPAMLSFIRKMIAKAASSSQRVSAPAIAQPYYDFLHSVKIVAEQQKSVDSAALKEGLDKFSGAGLFGPMKLSVASHAAYDDSREATGVVLSKFEPRNVELQGLVQSRGPGTY